MWASRRVSTPHVGKGEIAKARMRAAAGINKSFFWFWISHTGTIFIFISLTVIST